MISLENTLVLSIVCSKYKNGGERIFKGEDSIDILKLLGLMKICNYFKNMAEESVSQEFRFKNIDETRNYLIE